MTDRRCAAWDALDALLRERADLVRAEFDPAATAVHRAVAGIPIDGGPTRERAAAENELARALDAVGRDGIEASLALRLAEADLRIGISCRIYDDAVAPERFPLAVSPNLFAMTSIRHSARVVVVDPAGRVLLMRYHDPANGPVWITPGGGLEPGEPLRTGAARELREETGILAAPEELDGPVWFRRVTVSWQGRRVEAHEWYYRFRTTETTVDTSGFTTAETAFVEPPRWWDLEDLAETRERVSPTLDQLAPLAIWGQGS